MMRCTMLSVGLLSAAVFAQDEQGKVDLKIGKAQGAVRYTIESSSSSTSDREVLVDGEPMEGRGGFGGGGATKSETKVMFDEGRDGSATWRVYRHANARFEMPGRDGEPMTNEVEGGMLGERLHIVEDDRGVVVRRDDADGEELPPMMSRGIPARTNFARITPKQPVAIGEEFEMPARFLKAMESVSHPVRPAMDPNAAGGTRGGGQRPPRGGDAPEGGQRQPRGEGAQGRRFGGMRMMGGGNDRTTRLLVNENLDGKILGKVVELADGIAKVEFGGTRQAQGSLEEIGLSRGGRGGAAGGRRGGGFGAEGSGEVKMMITGVLWIDVENHSLVKLVIEGTTWSDTETRMGRGDREIEMNATSEGTFRYAVQAEAAPDSGEDK